jgi:Plasmid encoded RepA protein
VQWTAGLVSIGEQTQINDTLHANSFGVVPRLLVAGCLPRSKPAGHFYSHVNGSFRITVLATPDVGLPYGAKPRLLLAFLATEALRTKSREIVLGRSLRAFMRTLGLSASGGKNGSISGLKDQMLRLFSSTVSTRWDDGHVTSLHSSAIASEARMWWDPLHTIGHRKLSVVTLGEEFYSDLIERPVPVDMRALRALKNSSLGLDIYVWLTYRMSYLRVKSAPPIPWSALAAQFGPEYSISRQGLLNFRQRFTQQLQNVLLVYPNASVSITRLGVSLQPSPPHVAKRKARHAFHA